ncbi:MAG TPA: hypothetical protein VFK32_03795 [Tepidiformaceae bacterium]|nr:hypothetical protein [Tepidiformaceae bacterium]
MTEPGQVDWEMVWSGDGEIGATIVADSLRQDGYNAVSRGLDVRTIAFSPVGVQQTWVVLVPAGEAPSARELLSARHEPGVAEAPLPHSASVQLVPLILLAAGILAVTTFVLLR